MFINGLQLLITALLILDTDADFDPFSDSIPFSIKWNGPLDPQQESQVDENMVTLPIMTRDKERYQCRFRNDPQANGEGSKVEPYDGPSAEGILDEFVKKTACSYRVESYWTYELCHGKQLRQYHEERDTKEDQVVTQSEFFLGRYKEDQPPNDGEVPTVTLDGLKYRYLAVYYDDGTLCDLTQAPRRATIKYICSEGARGDLYQIKETSTCEYSAIVLLAGLCNHPSYKFTGSSREISCHSLGGAPNKPKMQEDIDGVLDRKARTLNTRRQRTTTTTTTKAQQEATRTDIGKSEDELFLQNFLSGQHCIQGSSGWWSYELCYGKTVKQFHVERGKRVSNILLGKWDKENHLEWIQKHPNKRPRPKHVRKYISHFYFDGEVCAETNAPRMVEVKMRCVSGGSSHAVAIYLLEPETCEYILAIESPVLCSFVDRADDQGLILP